MRFTLVAVLALIGAAQDDLKAKFEAKRGSDPVTALKLLADAPGDVALQLARPAIAKFISEDIAAGLKGYAENKADLAEKHLTRAAFLADPYGSDLSRQLMRILITLKQPRKTLTACTTCKGAGAGACGGCQAGLALQNCTRCEAKGSVNCILCDGAGTVDHHGYKGTLVLTIERDTRVTFKNDQGKTVRGTLDAQTVTYQMSLCNGGSFSLQTENQVAKTGAKKNLTVSQPCARFWTEMKMFAFSGKAKIKVHNNKGQLTPLTSTSARRFFADYEICGAGRVTCDRCTGRKSDTCSQCIGKGQANLPCPKCDGTALVACVTCRGYGDALWLVRALPQDKAAALSKALAEQAAVLQEWISARAMRSTRQQDMTRRLAEAKKGVDPTAKLTDDYVDVVCPKCKGSGGECEECWGAGRREHYQGTSQYERYALAQRLERQLADAAKAASAPPPALSPLPESEAGVPAPVVKETPKPVVDLSGPGAKTPMVGNIPIPATVDEMVKKADELHESGKSHFEKSKASNDNAVWIDEAHKAIADLKNAQMLYTTAQEKLDETNAPIPRTLTDKFRTNMQALVMARKQAP